MTGFLFAPPPPVTECLFSMRIPCRPSSKQRGDPFRTGKKCGSCKRRMGHLKIKTPDETRDLMALVAAQGHRAMRAEGLQVFSGALAGVVVGVFRRPKKLPLRDFTGRQWRPHVPDFDNVTKLVFDALNGVVYDDDRLAVDGRGWTVYAAAWEQPGFDFYLWRPPLTPPELDVPAFPPHNQGGSFDAARYPQAVR